MSGADAEALRARLRALDDEIGPVRARLSELAGEAEALRAELRRLERLDLAQARAGLRARLSAGEMPTLEEVIAAADLPDTTRFDELAYLRESATEVRLGYASASRQEVSFTDGSSTVDAADLGTARGAWRQGFEFGTVAARGVRVYPVGSRAEKMVPPSEVRVRLPG